MKVPKLTAIETAEWLLGLLEAAPIETIGQFGLCNIINHMWLDKHIDQEVRNRFIITLMMAALPSPDCPYLEPKGHTTKRKQFLRDWLKQHSEET